MDFQQEYIEEAKQILVSLEQSLLQLEQSPNHPEEIANVFRYLHTLKGSAGMFGFQQVERLSHELESVFSDIRDGKYLQDDFILDITLHAVDVFSDLIDGNDATAEVDKLIASVHNIKGSADDEDNTELDAASSPNTEAGAFTIFLKPDENIFKRGINLNAILEEIQELGPTEVIVHNETIPLEQQLETKTLHSWLEIITRTSQSIDDIKDILLFLNQKEYDIVPLDNPAVFVSEIYKNHISLSEAEIEKRIALIHEGKSNEAKDSTAAPSRDDAEAPEVVSENQQNTAEGSDEPEESTSIKKSKKSYSHVNVATPKLDQLIDIVSEMVTFRSELHHLVGNRVNPQITEAMEKLEHLTLRLRDSAFNIRLVPLNTLQVKLQRLIRSVSKELGKEVEFITDGLDTELDRSIINAMEAPLMHIIRNAIDHGIESPEERIKRNKPEKGLLKLYSYNSGDHVFIQIQDDGNGIDFEKIREKGIANGLLNSHQQYSKKELLNVMMEPGFSTADKVTTVSGRGVGMDVVKKEINILRGDIDITTEEGLGSIITLRLPLTLTVLDTLVVNISEQRYLIPINEIEYCYKDSHENLFNKKSRQIKYEGQLLPFVSLREHFGEVEYPENETVIVVNKNDTKIAIVVDDIIGQYQTVYKPLNEMLRPIDCFSGASILGDGSTALILNALKLMN